MRLWFATMLTGTALHPGLCIAAPDQFLEQWLRGRPFSQVFNGIDSYSMTREADQPQADGSRKVTAVGGGILASRSSIAGRRFEYPEDFVLCALRRITRGVCACMEFVPQGPNRS